MVDNDHTVAATGRGNGRTTTLQLRELPAFALRVGRSFAHRPASGRRASARPLASVAQFIAALSLLFLAACQATPANPNADPRGFWFTHDPDSTAKVDHSAWDRFLKKYVVDRRRKVNLVKYTEVTADDKPELDAYIDYLQSIPITKYNRDEQIAYWMNLYNSTTVKLVLEHWPVESILDIRISPGRGNYGPWGRKLLNVEGKALALEDIEHHILRKVFDDADPKVHYGLNCASIGCPSLIAQAITGDNWHEVLAANAEDYVNSVQGVDFQRPGVMEVSKIYHSWFQGDFGGTEQTVIEHLLRYADGTKAEQIRDAKGVASDFYDWRINAATVMAAEAER